MPTDTLQRFREEALRLGGSQKKRRGELLEQIRADAAAVFALTAETPIGSMQKHLGDLLEEMRENAEKLRAATEASIAGALALADLAARVWEAMWEAALGDPAANDRPKVAPLLRWVVEDAEQHLREALHWAQKHAHLFERPLARLDELEARATDFPLWARERLARWEMLDSPAPTLDPERIARAQAAYARGEQEDVEEMLSRVQSGGAWVKE